MQIVQASRAQPRAQSTRPLCRCASSFAGSEASYRSPKSATPLAYVHTVQAWSDTSLITHTCRTKPAPLIHTYTCRTRVPAAACPRRPRCSQVGCGTTALSRPGYFDGLISEQDFQAGVAAAAAEGVVLRDKEHLAYYRVFRWGDRGAVAGVGGVGATGRGRVGAWGPSREGRGAWAVAEYSWTRPVVRSPAVGRADAVSLQGCQKRKCPPVVRVRCAGRCSRPARCRGCPATAPTPAPSAATSSPPAPRPSASPAATTTPRSAPDTTSRPQQPLLVVVVVLLVLQAPARL